jgi:hypothetical protein
VDDIDNLKYPLESTDDLRRLGLVYYVYAVVGEKPTQVVHEAILTASIFTHRNYGPKSLVRGHRLLSGTISICTTFRENDLRTSVSKAHSAVNVL